MNCQAKCLSHTQKDRSILTIATTANRTFLICLFNRSFNSKTLFFYDVSVGNQPFMRYSQFKCNIIGYLQPAMMLTLLHLSNSAWKLCFSYISDNSKQLFFYDISFENQPLKRYSYFKCSTKLLQAIAKQAYQQVYLEQSCS